MCPPMENVISDPNKQATELHFCRKINSPNHPSLYFDNQEVCRAADHKHLGLLLDTKLTFTKHITQTSPLHIKVLVLSNICHLMLQKEP